MTEQLKPLEPVDEDDVLAHAPWCDSRKSTEEDEVDCNCDPCTGCNGHASYGDENGDKMTCIACDGLPWMKTGSRKRTAR